MLNFLPIKARKSMPGLNQDLNGYRHTFNRHERGSFMRGLLSFCVNYARILKVPSLINKITLKRKKGILISIPKIMHKPKSMNFSGPSPGDTVKFENIGPTFLNFRPFLFYLSQAKLVLNNRRDQNSAFQKGWQLLRLIPSLSLDFQVALNLVHLLFCYCGFVSIIY